MPELPYQRVVDQLPKPEKVPLPKLMEAVLPYQASVYVTVLNIIQCIAFGFLINEVREIHSKGELGIDCFGRSLLALGIILVIWHRYTVELQYLWPISWVDTVRPFAIGISECIIIFSINDAKVPLKWFIVSVIMLQLLALAVNLDAYIQRSSKITERLYREFYKDYPIFADYLIIWLKLYDFFSLKFMRNFLLQTAVFLILVWIHPFRAYETFFPLICISNIITGEYLRGFHKWLRTDPVLGPCFTKGGD